MAFVNSDSVSSTCTNCPGHNALSSLGNVALSWIVPVVISTVLSMKVNSPCGGGRPCFEMCLHFQRFFAHFPFDFRQILLRHGKGDINRMNLIDGQQRVVRGFDDIALVKLQAARPSINRRANIGEAPNSIRRIALSPRACPWRPCWCRNSSCETSFWSNNFCSRVNWISAFSNCAVSVRQHRLHRPRVNREQRVVLFDRLAFLKMHLADDAAHLRADGHRRIRPSHGQPAAD